LSGYEKDGREDGRRSATGAERGLALCRSHWKPSGLRFPAPFKSKVDLGARRRRRETVRALGPLPKRRYLGWSVGQKKTRTPRTTLRVTRHFRSFTFSPPPL